MFCNQTKEYFSAKGHKVSREGHSAGFWHLGRSQETRVHSNPALSRRTPEGFFGAALLHPPSLIASVAVSSAVSDLRLDRGIPTCPNHAWEFPHGSGKNCRCPIPRRAKGGTSGPYPGSVLA